MPCSQWSPGKNPANKKNTIPRATWKNKTSTELCHNPSYIEAKTSSHQTGLLSFAQLGMWRRRLNEGMGFRIEIPAYESYHMISPAAFKYSTILLLVHICLRRNSPGMDFFQAWWITTHPLQVQITGQLPQTPTARWGQLISSGNTLPARLVGEVPFLIIIDFFPRETNWISKSYIGKAFCETGISTSFQPP